MCSKEYRYYNTNKCVLLTQDLFSQVWSYIGDEIKEMYTYLCISTPVINLGQYPVKPVIRWQEDRTTIMLQLNSYWYQLVNSVYVK